ncbi:MAG: bifunctional phosphopantothenoylcysteine decarboxylase/phosphopantothenate--cysteine ligase CoaBC [Candidatus Cohnella colombiensis]|uniref:Coenzyme A biosynthesis bifunctional protein CoaBC n=1 Tax=Candidatus Cohnella colombiensis TaxID=3121368 RepID=A0AA95JBG6_9BACL|nr:MAG: bifunctional phosphopantothenoylcysteine decarboxylase/phosphopantothenate--cysteine ligase CoaBC [Cohnella sp.]
MDKPLTGKTIILGITGGIAGYKAATLCSRLVSLGAAVRVIMTEGATKFITPLTLQTISRHPVATDVFDERDASIVQHIDWADAADLVVVAPATANSIAKMAHGLADDMLSTTLLAVTAPILVAPAMNVHMWEHPAVVDNVEKLAARGVTFVEPGTGQLACGYVGKGRLAEPDEIVSCIVEKIAGSRPLRGQRVLITAGGTIERIDPVRYITNDSSGKMGFAFAEAARDWGAEVTLIYGRVDSTPPQGVHAVSVTSADEMYEAVMSRLPEQDIVIKSAAVADYRPRLQETTKIKKKDEVQALDLVRNRDILHSIGLWKEQLKQQGKTTLPFIVGFAAETNDLEKYAMDKLNRKKCDLIVANDVSQSGAGFGTETNIVSLYDADGLLLQLPQLSKKDVAKRVLDIVLARIGAEKGLER